MSIYHAPAAVTGYHGGEAIFIPCVSQKRSDVAFPYNGCYQVKCIAAELLNSYPDNKVFLMDVFGVI